MYYKAVCSCSYNVFKRIDNIFVCANCGKPVSDEQGKNIDSEPVGDRLLERADV